MSDKFYPVTIDQLYRLILSTIEKGHIFGIPKELYFHPKPTDRFRMKRYGRLLETPIGVAAGPHTQMAQNIIATYLTGGRYIELKTIQTLDELDVTKPCIDMFDEGYNCEWSQELKVQESIDEYVNAWVILHVLKEKLGWGDPGEAGFIFNMSVGYNLEGIQNPNVQHFFEKMNDSGEAIAQKLAVLKNIDQEIGDIDIPSQVSNNVTLSTMHGCPPDEIEKIGKYLIEEKKLHTVVKLNPTLLGPDRLRKILNDQLGFKIIVPDIAFEHDLKYDDGVEIIRSLQKSAAKTGVEFGLKLTNTLEVINQRKWLPEKEATNYMSGRALHAISCNLAERLHTEFDGELDISFSSGAECFNVSDILACNLKPVTASSNLLKPGGYTRLGQFLSEIDNSMADLDAKNLDEFITRRAGGNLTVAESGLTNLQSYARNVVKNPAYHASFNRNSGIKTERKLGVFDCVSAPCINTCAVNQDIPDYMYHVSRGEFEKAYTVIKRTNPLPNITGKVCDHLCQSKCTRINYDSPLLIREVKRFVAGKNKNTAGIEQTPKNGIKVAIVGAGPAGLSCGYFLALDGFDVEIFESKEFAGGMTADAIPGFRLDQESLNRDIAAVEAAGVKINCGQKIDKERFDELKENYDYMFIAIGAQKSRKLGVPGEEADGVHNQLTFLSESLRGQQAELGKHVIVIGGGNTAVDAAMTARRLGAEKVSMICLEAEHEMPAYREEIESALVEGIEIIPRWGIERIESVAGKFSAVVLKRCTSVFDNSGRFNPAYDATETRTASADTLIVAIGQEIDLDFLPGNKLKVDAITRETQFENVFAGGDAVRGASTLIKAISDGKKVAETIKHRAYKAYKTPLYKLDKGLNPVDYQIRQANRKYGVSVPEIVESERLSFNLLVQTLDDRSAKEEAERCLYCNDFCNICVSVCPNRANVGYEVDPVDLKVGNVVRSGEGFELQDVATFRIEQRHQIFNIGDFCNHCGNCVTFCPTSGQPFVEKPTFYLTKKGFETAEIGYMILGDVLVAKTAKGTETMIFDEDIVLYETDDVKVKISCAGFEIIDVKFKSDSVEKLDLHHAAEMFVYLSNIEIA